MSKSVITLDKYRYCRKLYFRLSIYLNRRPELEEIEYELSGRYSVTTRQVATMIKIIKHESSIIERILKGKLRNRSVRLRSGEEA